MRWPWSKGITEKPDPSEVWPVGTEPPVTAKDRDNDPPHPRIAALAEYVKAVAAHDAEISAVKAG